MRKILTFLIFILILIEPVNADLLSYHKSNNLVIWWTPPQTAYDTNYIMTDNSISFVNKYVYYVTTNHLEFGNGNSYIDIGYNDIIKKFNTYVHFGQWDLGCTFYIWGSQSPNSGFVNIGSFLDEDSDFVWKNVTITNTNSYRYFRYSKSVECGTLSQTWTEIQIFNSTSFNASGNIKYKDVDDSLNNLQNVFVYINSTLYDYTDSNGNYEILDIPNGQYTLYINKSNAFNTSSKTISQSSPVNNFTLLFSEPYLTTPVLSSRNTISSTYSNNIRDMELWENPNFVWGNYTFIDVSPNVSVIRSCNFYSGNEFDCDIIPDRNYKFNFIYSDVYNTNLTYYHPSLTGSRNFISSEIFIQNETVSNIDSRKVISKLGQKEREEILKPYFWNFLYLILILLVVGYLTTYDNKK